MKPFGVVNKVYKRYSSTNKTDSHRKLFIKTKMNRSRYNTCTEMYSTKSMDFNA